MIVRVDHIAFAVRDLEKAVTRALNYGGKHIFTSPAEKEGYVVAAVQFGECVLTFLEPIGEDSFVHKFLERTGEGVHHIGLEVENIEEYSKVLKSQGIKLTDNQIDGEGRKEFLVGPKDGFGTLLQVIEWPQGSDVTPEERIKRLLEYRS